MGSVSYVIRKGRRIEVETFEPGGPPPKKRFKPRFVMVPMRWMVALKRTRSVNAYRLALLILAEAFKDRHRTGKVCLSTAVTEMSRETKRRAAKELMKLGLIEVEKTGKQVLKVTILSND
jgi:hypothetical protein